ncbi:MAG: MFS transporter [Kofleriaceae bacterium]
MLAVVLRNSGFARLWAAGAVSLVGDWLSFVAVASLAIGHGGDAFGLAMVFGAHALPGALLAPVAGALVDGLDRRRVLIAADAIASLVTVGMMLAALAEQLALVSLLLLARSAVSAVVPPGESAAVRVLVPEPDLLAANSLLAATWSVAYVVGMALGGVAATLGPALALGIDAASFAVAAAIHATLPALPSPAARRPVRAILRDTPADTIAALRVAARSRPLLRAVLGKMPLGLASGSAWVALNLVGALSTPFGSAALSFGVLQAIRGAGTGIGPLVTNHLARRGVSERLLQGIAVALALAAMTGLAIARTPLALALVCLLWGTGTGANWVLSHAALQRHSDDAVIGRLAAFDELLVTLAMVLSALAGAALITWIDLAAGPLAAGALGALGVTLALATVRIVGAAERPAEESRRLRA